MTDSDHAEAVRRSFERQVALFSGPDSPFAARPSSTLAWIEPLTPDMIVLDVACGAAHAAEPVAVAVRQVVGVDLTAALLRVGAGRLHANGVHNVLLQEGDAEALPFLDDSFDVVFCRSSLHHFGAPRTAVAEMERVCRPSGRVVLVDLVVPEGVDRDLFDRVHRLLDPSHVRTFAEAELADLTSGGASSLTYANTATIRLPVDVAITEQSDAGAVRAILDDELSGTGSRSGFAPEVVDDQCIVSFTTTILHAANC
ncbi:MAG TPA: methyltransferase domain-containing protein [Acidimicrobiia bacterium]|jgi:SAM-dependent methyltransferase